jgi:hypothetical protein
MAARIHEVETTQARLYTCGHWIVYFVTDHKTYVDYMNKNMVQVLLEKLLLLMRLTDAPYEPPM